MTSQGIGFGCGLAMVLGYAHHHSILWTILDGMLGWLYVLYFALSY